MLAEKNVQVLNHFVADHFDNTRYSEADSIRRVYMNLVWFIHSDIQIMRTTAYWPYVMVPGNLRISLDSYPYEANYRVTDNAETEMIPFFSNKIWFIMLEKLSNENYLASVCTISSTIYYILLNCYNYIFKFKTGLVFCNIILHNRRLTIWNAVTCWTDLKTALTIIDPEFMEVCVLW